MEISWNKSNHKRKLYGENLKNTITREKGATEKKCEEGEGTPCSGGNIPPEMPDLLELFHKFHPHCPNKSTKGFLKEPERLILELTYFLNAKMAKNILKKKNRGGLALLGI